MSKRRIIMLVVAFIMMAGLMVACSQETEPEEPTYQPEDTTPPPTEPDPDPDAGNEGDNDYVAAEPQPYRDHVNLILGQAPDTLDPQMHNTAAAGSVVGQIFDTLFWVTAAHGEHPRLALSYDVSEDGLTWTYHLRPGVVFSDGSPFTANDVVFTFERRRPDIFTDLIEEIVAIDDHTVEFRLNMVVATFHGTVSSIFIASESAVTAAGDDAGVRPIGTGPFVLDLDDFIIDQHITLTRNPLHWDYDNVQIQSATFYVITDALTQFIAFEAGDVDMLAVAPDFWHGVLESGLYNTITGSMGVVTYLAFNTTVAPWDDVRVRQAFSYAINNDLIIALAFGGIGSPAYTAAPPDLIRGAVMPDSPYHFNPERARELFEEAGVTDVGPLMTVAGITQSILEIMQQNLHDIGISMSIDVLDAPALGEARNSGNFTAATLGIMFTQEFNDYMVIYSSDGILNLSRLENPMVDMLFLQALTTMDQAARYEIYRQIINIVNEEARHYYIAHAIFTHAYHPNLAQDGWEDGSVLLRRFSWDLVQP